MHNRREIRKQTTRRQLLLAGRRMFGERGLYESRIEDLTSVAGIAKGTIYGYFADKDELVRAVVATGFEELLGAVHAAAARHRGRRARTEAVLDAHLRFFAQHPDLMRIFHQARGMLKFQRPEWRLLRDSLREYLGQLALILDPPPRGRAPRTRPSFRRARCLFGAVSGVTSIDAALEVDFARASERRATVRALATMVDALHDGAPARARRPGAR